MEGTAAVAADFSEDAFASTVEALTGGTPWGAHSLQQEASSLQQEAPTAAVAATAGAAALPSAIDWVKQLGDDRRLRERTPAPAPAQMLCAAGGPSSSGAADAWEPRTAGGPSSNGAAVAQTFYAGGPSYIVGGPASSGQADPTHEDAQEAWRFTHALEDIFMMEFSWITSRAEARKHMKETLLEISLEKRGGGLDRSSCVSPDARLALSRPVGSWMAIAQAEAEQVALPAAPAAAAVAAAGAVTAPPGLPVYGVEYFLGFKRFTGGFKQHNASLKWHRDSNEIPDRPFESPVVQFPNDRPAKMPTIFHDKGTSYWFSATTVTEEWWWMEMVAQLRDDDIRLVVTGGPNGRGRGLVSCECAPRPNSYDHKRQHKAVQQCSANGERPPTVKMPVWDFVLNRDDGTGIRLHPQWSDRSLETIELGGHAEPIEIPRKGLGKSDGRGTFKKFKALGMTGSVRFDPSKLPKGGKW